MITYQQLTNRKNEIYSRNQTSKIGFFEAKSSFYTAPGFFSPLRSLYDLNSTLNAPIVMPALCLRAALSSTLLVISDLSLALNDVLYFKFQNGGHRLMVAVNHFIAALYYSLSAIVDSLYSLVALTTRTGATVVDVAATAGVATFEAAKAGASAVKGYFVAKPEAANPVVTVEDVTGLHQQQDTGYDSDNEQAVAASARFA